MTTAADELRTAAATLRALANEATPGRWWAEELPPNDQHPHPAHWVKTEYDSGNNTATSEVVADCPWRQADADYIAAMHPGVGKALAAWLEAEAATPLTASHSDRCTEPDCTINAALAVARQINGTPR